MKIIAIRYTARSADLLDFYAALGFPVDVASRTGDWVELASSSAAIAVHHVEPGERPDERHAEGNVELAFEADEPLESIQSRLDEAGFPGAVIVDEAHGRSLRLLDPEGVPVQINEFDRELYT